MSAALTVYYEGSFWVGVLEITQTASDGTVTVRATRVVFGAEPSDAELYAYLQQEGVRLLDRAAGNPAVPASERTGARRGNPKRAIRQAARDAARTAAGRTSTAAQEAVRREYEERSRQAAHRRRDEHAARDAHRREMSRQKRAARRKGR